MTMEESRQGIGTIRCHVIDVDDLAVGETFWSAVTGLPVIGSAWTGRFSYLGQPAPWKHEIILQLVHNPKGPEANRSHIDIGVKDVDTAIAAIEAIGGRLKKEPSPYPRPGSFEGKRPVIDWAVMQDPFGNEFCLVSELTAAQVTAVEEAARAGASTDEDLRTAAQAAASPSHPARP